MSISGIDAIINFDLNINNESLDNSFDIFLKDLENDNEKIAKNASNIFEMPDSLFSSSEDFLNIDNKNIDDLTSYDLTSYDFGISDPLDDNNSFFDLIFNSSLSQDLFDFSSALDTPIMLAENFYPNQEYYEPSAFGSFANSSKTIVQTPQSSELQDGDYVDFQEPIADIEIIDSNKIKPTWWESLTGKDPNAIYSDYQYVDETRELINKEAEKRNNSITQQQYEKDKNKNWFGFDEEFQADPEIKFGVFETTETYSGEEHYNNYIDKSEW